MKKRIYIACPISPSGGAGNLVDNVRIASEAFFRLAKAGFAAWNPAWSVFSAGPYDAAMPQLLPEGTTHEDWLSIDLPWVAVSDAVLRIPGKSRGADQEVALAESLGIPVFHDESELIRHFSN